MLRENLLFSGGVSLFSFNKALPFKGLFSNKKLAIILELSRIINSINLNTVLNK